MEITHRVNDGWTELTIAGRLDGYWADHLDRGLADTVRDGHHRLRLNLANVTFLSSAGIGVVVKFYKRLTTIKGALVITSPSQQVRTVLRMTNLTDLLLDDTRPTALETSVGRMVVRGEAGAKMSQSATLEPEGDHGQVFLRDRLVMQGRFHGRNRDR